MKNVVLYLGNLDCYNAEIKIDWIKIPELSKFIDQTIEKNLPI